MAHSEGVAPDFPLAQFKTKEKENKMPFLDSRSELIKKLQKSAQTIPLEAQEHVFQRLGNKTIIVIIIIKIMFEIKEACKCIFNSSSTWPSGNFAL